MTRNLVLCVNEKVVNERGGKRAGGAQGKGMEKTKSTKEGEIFLPPYLHTISFLINFFLLLIFSFSFYQILTSSILLIPSFSNSSVEIPQHIFVDGEEEYTAGVSCNHHHIDKIA